MASSIPKPSRRATASFQGMSPVMKVPLDSRVTISRRRIGTIRYVGRIASETGEWYGIALDEAKGDNDGTWQKERYFQCPPNHGIFVRRKEIFQVKEPLKSPPSPGAQDSGDEESTSGSSTTEQQDLSALVPLQAPVTPLMRTFKSFRKQLENITIKTIGGESGSSSANSSRPGSPVATPGGDVISLTSSASPRVARSGIKEPASRRFTTFTVGESLANAVPSLHSGASNLRVSESTSSAPQSASGLLFSTSELHSNGPHTLDPTFEQTFEELVKAPTSIPSPSSMMPPPAPCEEPAELKIPGSPVDVPKTTVTHSVETSDASAVETVLDLSTLTEISESLILEGLEPLTSGSPRGQHDRTASFIRRNSDSTVGHVDASQDLSGSPFSLSPTERSASFVRRKSESVAQEELTQIESLARDQSPTPLFLRRTNIGSPSRLERRASFASGSTSPTSSGSSRSSMTSQQRNATSRVAELEKEIYTMRTNHENVIAVLRATNKQHAANVLELRAQVAALTEGNNYLERQLASKIALIHELQQMETHDRVTRAEVERVIQLKDAQIQTLEKEIAKLKQHVLRVETEKDSQLCLQFKHFSAARERDEERIAKLRQDVLDMCNERISLQSELHDLKQMSNWF